MTDAAISQESAAAIRPLRALVLRDGDTAAAAWPGDDASLHLAATVDDAIVGCLSLLPESCPDRPADQAWRLRGMAVAAEHRGTGIGADLMRAAVAAASASGIELIWCNARTTALGFYIALGWQVVGEEFATETGIAHYRAIRAVTASP